MEDWLVEIDDDDTLDAEYTPEDDSEDDNDTYSYDSNDLSDGGDFPDVDAEAPVQDPSAPTFGEAPDDDDDTSIQSQSTQSGPFHPENPGVDHDNNHNNEIGLDSESDDSSYQYQSDHSESDDSSWQSLSHTDEQPRKSTGVEEDHGQPDESTGVEEDHGQSEQSHESTGVQAPDCTEVQEDEAPTLPDIFERAADSGRMAASQQNDTPNLRKDTLDPSFQYMVTAIQDL